MLMFLFLLALVFNLNSMDTHSPIFIAGHNGLVGSAIYRELRSRGYQNLILHNSSELNLSDQAAVNSFFAQTKPEYVFLCAAKVGGIKANIDYPAQFIYENLMIQSNVIHAAYKNGVKKLLFLGSSCIYPRDCPQPIKEEYLLTSPLERSNDNYALAKIAGLKMCQSYNKQYGTNFISCMPTNLYGPGDNFSLNNSHVLPALIRKIYQAKIANLPNVVIWGSGNALREFLYIDDMADAAIYLMQNYNGNTPVNIGTGIDISIRELANQIKQSIGFNGELIFDTSMPDGTPRKLLDVSLAEQLGWHAQTNLTTGIQKTLDWYVANILDIRK
jgi:GDP-L-fucose synthase